MALSRRILALDWVDWFNSRRFLEPIGDIPPVELQIAHYRQLEKSHADLAQTKESPEYTRLSHSKSCFHYFTFSTMDIG